MENNNNNNNLQVIKIDPPKAERTGYYITNKERTLEFLSKSKLTSFDDLCKTILALAGVKKNVPKNMLGGLLGGILKFQAYMQKSNPKWDFYADLLPDIQNFACNFSWQPKIFLSEQGVPSTIALEKRQILHLNANAFFLNVREDFELPSNRVFGTMGWASVYFSSDSVGIARVACNLSYFCQAAQSLEKAPQKDTWYQEKVIFERLVIPNSVTAPDWKNDHTVIDTNLIHLSLKRMEDFPKSDTFFDFANKDIQIHQNIPSATQEEVLFSMCPECFPALSFIERLSDNEIVMIRGVERYSDYTGYLMSFAFTGFYQNNFLKYQDIIVADSVIATLVDQYKKGWVRDTNKAWLGFQASKLNKNGGRISTGNWGTGAFGGNKMLKFLQQVCASTVTKKELDYSTFKEQNTFDELSEALNLIQKKKVTVSDIYNLCTQFPKNDSFPKYVLNSLKQK